MTHITTLLLVVLAVCTLPVASFRFSISGSPSCDGSPFKTSSVTATCSNECEPGDTVTVTGKVQARSGFDNNAKVKLQPCVSGPASLVSYYCFDPQDMGGICDWVSSESVSCGSAASDYVIYQTITIPKEAEQLETRFGSFLTIKVKAIIGGEEECGADYNSYGMAASFVGAALLLGLAVRGSRRRYAATALAAGNQERKDYIEMGNSPANGLLA